MKQLLSSSNADDTLTSPSTIMHDDLNKKISSQLSLMIEAKAVTPPGKTMNSYLRNHDIMGMPPSPQEAEKRGLAPQDIFPHT
jgi:hypothetical protein